MLIEIIGPLLLFIGIAGNSISFYVFTNEALRGLSIFRFLTYLSIIDFCYLLTGLTHLLMIIYFDYDLRLISNFLCSFHSFTTIFLSHLSSNTLAAISVSRCFKLVRLKPNRKTNLKRSESNLKSIKNKNNSFRSYNFGHADLTILVIVIVLFLFDSHYLVWMRLSEIEEAPNSSNQTSSNTTTISKIRKFQCHPSLSKQFYYNKFLSTTWVWVDLFLYSYIPFVIMMVCTVLITYKLCKVNKSFVKRHHSSATNYSRTQASSVKLINNNFNNTVQSVNNQFKKRAKKTNQIYKLLILINVCFFILVTPLVLSNSLGILVIENKIILELVYILSYLNHCINFVFYGLSCKVYRTILHQIFFKKKTTNANISINNNNLANLNNKNSSKL